MQQSENTEVERGLTEIVRSTAERAEVCEQLGRMLRSELFAGARRLSGFLEFVVKATLDGIEVKEALIGVEVYGRDASYNPKTDSIVRAEASRLRAKLREYYDGQGQTDPILIDLPKGGYTPVFQRREPPESPQPAQQSRPRLPMIAGVCLAVVGAVVAGVLAWRILAGAWRVPSIAVMPLRKAGPEQQAGPLSETLTTHLLQELLASRSWKVAGRAPELDLIGKDQMLEPLRKDFKAEAVLTGTVRALTSQDVRITFELLNVADGYLVWRETHDRRLIDATESQAEMAHAAVQALTMKYSGRPATPRGRAYALAREHWSARTATGYEQSIPNFRQAIEADPKFAPAWAGLADAQHRLSLRSDGRGARELTEAARQAATKAIALDDSVAEAHAVLGHIYLYRDWNFQSALRSLQRAVSLDPSRVQPAVQYSEALTIVGDMEQAHKVIRDARGRLPFLPELLVQEGCVFFLARKYEKMEALGREVLAVDPDSVPGHWLVGLSLEMQGRVREAISELEGAIRNSARPYPNIQCALSHAYGISGDRAKALETMHRFLPDLRAPLGPYTLSYCAALTFTSLGDREEAFTWLEKAWQMHDASFPFFPSDARFDALKTDARYARLVSTIR